MKRRHFLGLAAATGLVGSLPGAAFGFPRLKLSRAAGITPLELSDAEWQEKLTAAQYDVLRGHATEPAFSSPLNDEWKEGRYQCAGCELVLFESSMKFESGTGWPSFFDHVKGHLLSKLDFSVIWPRTEYHCARCGGHQGHVFGDGPDPSGLRWCNNGVALHFVPA